MGCKLLPPSDFHPSNEVIQVSPIQTYFAVYMPKLLLSSTFLAPFGFLVDSRLNTLVVQALSFVACLSFLGHKEWRFIIYVVPLFNIAAARGARALLVSLCSIWKYLLCCLTSASHGLRERFSEDSVSWHLLECCS